MHYDLKAALNAISDVVQNRPLPLREFDQIYMKVGDMVEQASFIADRFQNLDVVFIGDGDSIALSVMHLWKSGIFAKAPRRILVACNIKTGSAARERELTTMPDLMGLECFIISEGDTTFTDTGH